MAHEHTFEFEEANQEQQQSGLSQNKCLTCVKTNVITLATVAGVVLGAILGIILRQIKDDWTEREIMYVGYIGDVFLQMLKSLIIPLIVSSLVSAIAGLDVSLSGKIAARAVAFYLTTTFAAVLLGMILVSTIRPGVGSTVNETTSTTVTERNTTTADTLLDLVKNMFPPNIPEALIFQYRTKLTPRHDFDTDKLNFKISTETVQTTNILGLIIVSFVTGVALAQLGKETKVIADFFHQLMTLTMKITMWVIQLSPVGVMFLVTCKILEMEDFGQVMSSLGMYFLTVCLGLFIQGFIVIPCLYLALTRKNPIHFINAMGQALATAFGTGSSSATLPITIRCLEENLGIDPRVARFTLPIGAAINMDGTALYEAVAAIFIAQVRGVYMDVGTLVAISITATAASIGAAGIPQAGLVTMVMVLDTVGLPAEDVTLILAVDWFLDRLRTAINVLGDAVGSAIVNHRSQKELNEASKEIPPIPTHGPALMSSDNIKDHSNSATMDIDEEKN